MNIIQSNKYGSTTSEQLRAFESRTGVKLPQDYFDWLLEHNGGKPRGCVFDSQKTSSRIHHFYGLHNTQHSSLEFHCGDDQYPDSLIQIGDDPFGNQILLGVKGKRIGKVFFWDHETYMPRLLYFLKLDKIADTFSEFMNNCYEVIDPDETEEQRILRTNDIETLKKLIAEGWDVNLTFSSPSGITRSFLEKAAMADHLDMCKLLIENGATDIKSALSGAELFSSFSVIEYLKSLPSSPDTSDAG